MIPRAVLLLPIVAVLLYDPLPPDAFAIKRVAVLAMAVLVALPALRCRRVTRTPIDLAITAFVLVRGWMLLRAPAGDGELLWFGTLVALAIVHPVAVSTPVRRFLRRWAPLALGATGGVVALFALAQWALGWRQAHATFANRNFAAAGLAMLLPWALAVRGHLRVVLALGIAAGIAATQSRGGALAAAAALGLWLAWRRGTGARWAVAAALPVVVLAGGLLLGESNTVKARLAWYDAAWHLGLEKPLLGQGAGGFAREYPTIRPREEYAISGGARVHAVHDDYLESWADGGIVGLGAHVGLLLAAAFALRKRRAALASVLAFATASLVDLPMRDPSLLALLFLAFAFAPRRAAVRRAAWPMLAVAVLALAALLWPTAGHWRADRVFGRYLAHRPGARPRALLDEVLALEPTHAGALIERSLPGDLERLIAMRPNDADALYNATRDLSDEDAIAALQAILERHDRWHTLTRVRLAQLLADKEPLRADSILETAIAADPRPWRPWWLRARIAREQGQLDAADRRLSAAEERVRADPDPRAVPAVALERLRLETARLRAGRAASDALAAAAAALPREELQSAVVRALDEVAAIEDRNPAPRLEREPGEDPMAFARRIQDAKEAHRRSLQDRLRAPLREALELAGLLVRLHPDAESFRLLADAARGNGDLDGARRAGSMALFLDLLADLGRGDESAARTSLQRALRAWPRLADDEQAAAALRAWAAAHPDRVALARRLLEPWRGLRDVLGGG